LGFPVFTKCLTDLDLVLWNPIWATWLDGNLTILSNHSYKIPYAMLELGCNLISLFYIVEDPISNLGDVIKQDSIVVGA
jgi:hypothetical protein